MLFIGTARGATSITSCRAWVCMQIAFAQRDLIKDAWGGFILLEL